ncbi:beta-1,3-galactosyltransferase brn-like [Ylistrum balloti]|uniref:beta-1,3-galactosyltransferase brn-like n=1 Tax=Ylistrum balloti TaxID=509963 RepID=UPI0029058B8E|nr:beta-1,3-galactosyltransferase brn-like [Ylistrum balloti]
MVLLCLRRRSKAKYIFMLVTTLFLFHITEKLYKHNDVQPKNSEPSEYVRTLYIRHDVKTTSATTLPPTYKVLPFREFRYPLDINFTELINNISSKGYTDIAPINVYPFTFAEPTERICGSVDQIFLLLMIKSAPGNFDQRQAVRETWANKSHFENYNIRHTFLLARTMNKSIQERLSLEKKMNHDILEFSYIDGYYNNTFKSTGGINWCVKHCPQTKFVMLLDDDMYLATDFLLDYLHGLPQDLSHSLFAGRMWHDAPQRGPEQKWYMSFKDYPFDRYPPFLSAGATIMSMDIVKKLQIGIQYTKKFKFDDVFLAIVAYKLGIKPVHHPGIRILKRVPHKDKSFQTILASHEYGNPKDLKAAWLTHLQLNKTDGMLKP